MVIMDDDTTTIRVAIDSLTSFASFVFKTILFKGPNEFSDWCIFESVNHMETATAGSSITLM